MSTKEILSWAERHARAELSIPRTIAAAEVQSDDLIYDGSGHWIRVVDVRPSEGGDVVIETVNWTTYKHPREGIAVKRSDWT